MNIEKLKTARDFLATIPEEVFDLDVIQRRGTGCKTICCGMGWLAQPTSPLYGEEGGLHVSLEGSFLFYGDNYGTYSHIAALIFDISRQDARELFSTANQSTYDNLPGTTDKEMLMHRFECFFAENDIK